MNGPWVQLVFFAIVVGCLVAAAILEKYSVRRKGGL